MDSRSWMGEEVKMAVLSSIVSVGGVEVGVVVDGAAAVVVVFTALAFALALCDMVSSPSSLVRRRFNDIEFVSRRHLSRESRAKRTTMAECVAV